ncbi:MAG: hypothetical protein MUC60_07830 [Oscillatoria sp. Prado101]|nr:hypothetical protein [Oscillatoria sp. Prado101]
MLACKSFPIVENSATMWCLRPAGFPHTALRHRQARAQRAEQTTTAHPWGGRATGMQHRQLPVRLYPANIAVLNQL